MKFRKWDRRKNCLDCNTEIFVGNENDRCRKCYYKWKVKDYYKTCPQCKNQFKIQYLSYVKRRTYCSRKCTNESPKVREVRRKTATKHGRAYNNMSERQKYMKSSQYRAWRKGVLKRDNFKCIKCGDKKDLHVDHIYPYMLYPDKRLELKNGRVLCAKCHRKTLTYCGIDKKKSFNIPKCRIIGYDIEKQRLAIASKLLTPYEKAFIENKYYGREFQLEIK